MWAGLVELAKIAPIITALVAVGGVSIAICQLRSNQKNQQESTAKSIFREYLRLAFEHSDLAKPNYQKLAAQDRLEEYSWFVAHLLWACEEMLQYPMGELWKRTYRGMWTCTVSISSIIQTSRKKTSPFTTSQCKILCETLKPRTKNN